MTKNDASFEGNVVYFIIILPVLFYDYVLYIYLCMSKPIHILFIYKHNFKHDVHAPYICYILSNNFFLN